jgi:GntR family transcriptional regulator, rspAB operon transcriptional repressor
LDEQARPEAKKNLKQQSYEVIKSKILDCEYAPNQLLNEQILCDELGSVSRTPVRDAVSRLEQEGLVSILPKKGILVAPLNIAEIGLLYEARLLLEPYALLHYGNKISSEEWAKLQSTLNALSQSPQKQHYSYELDNLFHQRIIDVTGNHYIIDAFENTKNANHRIRILSGNVNVTRKKDTVQEHLLIIAACLEENWESAAQAMTTHLEHSRSAAFHLLISSRANI